MWLLSCSLGDKILPVLAARILPEDLISQALLQLAVVMWHSSGQWDASSGLLLGNLNSLDASPSLPHQQPPRALFIGLQCCILARFLEF